MTDEKLVKMARAVARKYGRGRDLEQEAALGFILAAKDPRRRISELSWGWWKARGRVTNLLDTEETQRKHVRRYWERRRGERPARSDIEPLDIADAIEQLPANRLRQIIYRQFWLGQTPTEIAEELGLNVAMVKYYRHRALVQLRAILSLDTECCR